MTSFVSSTRGHGFVVSILAMIARMTDVARQDGLDFHFERIRSGKRRPKTRPLPGEHDAIVDRETWDRVHAMLQESPRKRAAAASSVAFSFAKQKRTSRTSGGVLPRGCRRSARIVAPCWMPAPNTC